MRDTLLTIALIATLSGAVTHAQTAPPLVGMDLKEGSIVVPATKIVRDTADINAAPRPPGEIEFDDKAFILSTSIWTTRTIFVCWENPSEANAREREIVRAAVAESWQKYSALDFSGWQKCQDASQGIRIQIDDHPNNGPHTKGLGRILSGKLNGMVLNFDFRNWGQSCQAKRDECIYSITVHEFGHAIGFAHEQNRPDTPGECLVRHAPQGTSGDIMLTPWDLSSTMNYCNPVYGNRGILSPADIWAVQRVYGPRG